MSLKKLFIVAILVVMGLAEARAGAGTIYYCDCDVKLSSPSSAQGIVYIDMSQESKNSKNPTLQTNPSQNAQIKANFCSVNSSYSCYFLAYPKAGYALDGFISKKDYNMGNTSYIYHLKNSYGKTYKNGDYVDLAKVDTLRDSKNNPTLMSNYRFSSKISKEYYAIFRKATSQTVKVTSPGNLQSAIMRGSYSENVDNLSIIGPINETDLQYLKKLSTDYNLIRLDLSQAEIAEIPNYAFQSTRLYEVKLPTKGLIRVGDNAFANCKCLISCTIPSSVQLQGKDIFKDCRSMKLNIR